MGSLALAAALTGGTAFAQDFAYGMAEEPTAARGATPCWTGTMYYEHASYVGSYLGLAPGLGFSYVGSRMNDRISSLKSTPCGSWTALFGHSGFRAHVDWEGSECQLPGELRLVHGHSGIDADVELTPGRMPSALQKEQPHWTDLFYQTYVYSWMGGAV